MNERHRHRYEVNINYREAIEAKCAGAGRSLPDMLTEASTLLAGLSSCAGLVLAPKTDRPLKHIEFIHLGPGQALVVMVTEDGLVENRVIEVPLGLPSSSLVAATNWSSSAATPSTGAGSITATCVYNTTITGVTVSLTGIPASGVGSITTAIARGDAVNLEVLVESVSAQAALAALAEVAPAIGFEATAPLNGDLSLGTLLLDGPTTWLIDAARGVILDGFPRNRTQAEALEAALAARGAQVEAALYIEVPEADLLQRLSGRWLCQAHGHTYHDTAYPPRSPGVCDVDGSPLAQRDDDRPEIVAARLRNQLGSLEEVVEFYRPKGLLRTVDGRRPIAAVTADLLDHVELRPYWRHA